MRQLNAWLLLLGDPSVALGLIVILVALVGLNFFLWARANFEYNDTSFELIREMAGERRRRLFLRLCALTLMLTLVFVHLLLVAPRLRGESFNVADTELLPAGGTPTTTPTITPTAPVTDILGGGGPLGPLPTSTPTTIATSTPVGLILDANVPPAVCDNPLAQLQIPANGQRVYAPFVVLGIATADDFKAFRIELKGVGTGDVYAVVYESATATPNLDALWEFTPAAFPDGLYQFRLTVIATDDTLRAACEVNITIGP
jgi:nitrogen fixation-related uncharacterized protein